MCGLLRLASSTKRQHVSSLNTRHEVVVGKRGDVFRNLDHVCVFGHGSNKVLQFFAGLLLELQGRLYSAVQELAHFDEISFLEAAGGKRWGANAYAARREGLLPVIIRKSRTTSSVSTTFPIFYAICIGEHTCDLKLPHINSKSVKGGNSGCERSRTLRSPGTQFLLSVILHLSHVFSILEPVRPVLRRSHSRRWLSVPPVARS